MIGTLLAVVAIAVAVVIPGSAILLFLVERARGDEQEAPEVVCRTCGFHIRLTREGQWPSRALCVACHGDLERRS